MVSRLADRRLMTGFNGATLSTAWKTSRSRRRSSVSWQLQWGHAEHSVEDRPSLIGLSTGYCFNGATLSTAWKTPRVAAGSPGTTMLQWGHAEHSVEDDCVRRLHAASGEMLQWGHAEHSVEDIAGYCMSR